MSTLYILENNFRTVFKFFQNGQTALSIAQRLGYISVVETLKVVTQQEITTTTTTTIEEKYKILAPESMQETFMSDSEDEGGKISIHAKWSCETGIFQFNLFHFILPLPLMNGIAKARSYFQACFSFRFHYLTSLRSVFCSLPAWFYFYQLYPILDAYS